MITQDLTAPAGLPEGVLDTLKLYVFKRLPPGQFMRAVLSNDLQTAVAHADDQHLAALKRIAQFVYNDLPGPCWGSKAKVDAWLAARPQLV